MYEIRPDAAATTHEGHVDLSFRRAAGWFPMQPASTGGHLALLLLGDAVDGPMLVLGETPPTEAEPPRGPAHGHESDNWRISLTGTSVMGSATYGPGEFRFQTGGRPYGADSYAFGPEGGFHLVMFGDRRGFATQPVKREHDEYFAEKNVRDAAAFGIELPDPYPADARGLVTNIGTVDKGGRLDGTFAAADSWPEMAVGVRAAAGVFGHRTVGPLLLLLRCEPGAVAFPAATSGSEVLLMVVAGSCTIGDGVYERGDLRVQLAGAAMPAVVAGDGGLSLYLLVADRAGAGLEHVTGAWSPAALRAELEAALAAAV